MRYSCFRYISGQVKCVCLFMFIFVLEIMPSNMSERSFFLSSFLPAYYSMFCVINTIIVRLLGLVKTDVCKVVRYIALTLLAVLV